MNTHFTKSIYLYMAKCAAGCGLAYAASQLLPTHDMSWFLISIVLVLSPDSAESIPLAVTRIKANLLGAVSSVLLVLVGLPPLVGLAIALMLTVALCQLFNVMSGSRPALAAVIIIMLHHHEGLFVWDTVIERLAAVVAGCLAGLLLTFVFHRSLKHDSKAQSSNASE